MEGKEQQRPSTAEAALQSPSPARGLQKQSLVHSACLTPRGGEAALHTQQCADGSRAKPTQPLTWSRSEQESEGSSQGRGRERGQAASCSGEMTRGSAPASGAGRRSEQGWYEPPAARADHSPVRTQRTCRGNAPTRQLSASTARGGVEERA